MKPFFRKLLLIVFASLPWQLASGQTAYRTSQRITVNGSQFASFYNPRTSGNNLIASGAQDGRCIFFGGYRSWTGINEWYLAPRVNLSVSWIPEYGRTCAKRDWMKRCIKHNYHPLPHGFWIETVANAGTRKILEPFEVKNPTDLRNIWIELPQGHGFGDIKDLEFRACMPYGGPTFKLTLHKVEYIFSYNRKR